ncbi:MAG: DUF4160 domain-containing protein [Planctomycetia bacterium]
MVVERPEDARQEGRGVHKGKNTWLTGAGQAGRLSCVGQSGDAKFWLDPVELAEARGFADHEVREIKRIPESCQQQLLAAWRSEEAKHGDGSGDHSGT